MSWEQVAVQEIAPWVAYQQEHAATNGAYRVGGPELALVRMLEELPELRGSWRMHPKSGAIDIDLNDVRPEAQPYDLIYAVPARLDRRGVLESGSRQWQESGYRYEGVSSLVTDEFLLEVDGLAPVGPGGRVIAYGNGSWAGRGRATLRNLEIVCRPRTEQLGGVWRDPDQIAAGILNAFGPSEDGGGVLLADFGYYEASKYESQDVLRPVVVAVLQGSGDGEPRWRLSTVEAATDLYDEPPTAGLASSSGCA